MIKEQLLAVAEPEYQQFSSRLLPRTESIIEFVYHIFEKSQNK